jgi:hypothetical protein
MQICNCTVAIGGEVGMTVTKERVTVPEMAILRIVHGEDAVRNIEVIADEAIDTNEERSRLNSIYKSPENVVRDTFGASGVLPKTLDDAGISDEFVISDMVTKAGKRKAKASAAAEMTAAEVAGATDE